MFRTPTALLLTVGFAAIVLVNNAYVFWAPAFVEEKFDLPAKLAGRDAMLYHHLAALVGVLIGGRVADAFVGRRRQFRLELQGTAMLLGVPAIVGMGLATNLTATWIAMGTLGFFRGLYESNTHASLFDVIPPRYRASAVGMLVMLAFLAGSVSPWALGQCREMFPAGRGLSYGFAALSIAYLIGGLAVLAAVKTTFFRDYCEESPPT
jgi:sugar phosphate permease